MLKTTIQIPFSSARMKPSYEGSARPAVESKRKMTVRTLKDCRLVIVIFSTSCGKKGARESESENDPKTIEGFGCKLEYREAT
ncbi:hypothetical protein EYF80_013753 [Liparis tanakae]|uniref:Uncharacterized protein n=1 Tax=Liparis tanakae TaxID=230148 RepID=A0A4Z2IDE8_9TELE|nr:hypothetical protein EYF80_013753 [Liparis tanakae]